MFRREARVYFQSANGGASSGEPSHQKASNDAACPLVCSAEEECPSKGSHGTQLTIGPSPASRASLLAHAPRCNKFHGFVSAMLFVTIFCSMSSLTLGAGQNQLRCFSLCARSESHFLCRKCRYREPMRFGKRLSPAASSVSTSSSELDIAPRLMALLAAREATKQRPWRTAVDQGGLDAPRAARPTSHDRAPAEKLRTEQMFRSEPRDNGKLSSDGLSRDLRELVNNLSRVLDRGHEEERQADPARGAFETSRDAGYRKDAYEPTAPRWM